MKKLFTILAACLCVSSMWADRTFKLVTDVNDIDANGFYLFAQSYKNNNVTTNCLMGGANSATNRKVVSFTYQNELIVLQDAEIATSDAEADKDKAHVIKFVASETVSGAWNLYDVADGKYLDGGYVKSGNKNQNHLKAVETPTTAGSNASNDGHFNITISDGVATIKNQKNFVVRLNPNIQKGVAYPIFASYLASGSTGTDVKIYREIVAETTVSTAQYATYYNATKAYVMPEGLEGITVEDVSGTALTLNNHYAAGSVVPAGEALILHATSTLEEATSFTLYAGETSNPVVTENMLKGAASNMTASEMANENTGTNYFYALSLNSAGEASSVGFYWINEGGAAFDITAGKAYLVLPQSMFSSTDDAPAHFLFIEEEGIATDVENTLIDKQTAKFIENGQLIILKNGVRYNAVGQVIR